MSRKLKLENYTSDQDRLVSVLRLVPMNHLETVRAQVKQIVSLVAENNNASLDVRIRFRGPRYYSPMHTHKEYAEAFDVYVDTKNLPRKLSRKMRQEICSENRQSVIRTIRHGLENINF